MLNVLFATGDDKWEAYAPHLTAGFERAGIKAHLSQTHAADQVDYIIYAPHDGLKDFTPFTRCRAVLSLWAGVEKIVRNDSLTQPLCRMVDQGLSQGMVDWVTGHVMRHHLNLDWHIHNQTQQVWDDRPPPLATDRPITVLGMGALGSACARALANLGFPVTGWSRTQKSIDGINCLYGTNMLEKSLSTAQILILLLPLTPETENLINADRMAQLPRGAIILNPGRGPLIDDAALIFALDQGQIGHATLDVFRTEPLPKDHAFWRHPQVTVTPHIASTTRPKTAAQVIVENIRRDQAEIPLLYQVDRTLSY